MYNQMQLSDYEKIILNSSFDKINSSLLAGISRKTRLSYDLENSRIATVRELSSGLVAPVVFLYVLWVLLSAKKKKKSRLYFLAREGQIFKKVADILNDVWDLNLDLRYFYSSRESLLPSSFTGNNLFDAKWLFSSIYGSLCLQEICTRVCIDVSDLEPVLLGIGRGKYCDSPEIPLTSADLSTLRKMIFDDKFCSIVKNGVKSKAVTVVEYLKQVGMADGVPFALVDSGWSGSSQYALRKLLNSVGCKTTIVGFYVGVNTDIYSFPDDELCGFLFDWRKNIKNELMANFMCYEVLFSGTHGRTVGYENKDGCISPILFDKEGDEQSALVNIQHACATKYACDISKLVNYDSFSQHDSVALCTKLIDTFISKPSFAVASIYGEFGIGGEVGERDYQQLAPPVGVKLFLEYVFKKKKIRGLWFQASFVRSGNNIILFIYNFTLRSKFIYFYRKLLR